jgi:hypothetical protein
MIGRSSCGFHVHWLRSACAVPSGVAVRAFAMQPQRGGAFSATIIPSSKGSQRASTTT